MNNDDELPFVQAEARLPDFPTSLPGFQQMFPDEHACAAYLEDVRWPEGFSCQYCGVQAEPYRFENRAGVLRCRACQRDTSLTAGTVMERTHTPLCLWFWAAFLVTSRTPGESALQLQRSLGLKRYETAFQMLHKLRAGMVRPDRDPIGGQYLGAEQSTVCCAIGKRRTTTPPACGPSWRQSSSGGELPSSWSRSWWKCVGRSRGAHLLSIMQRWSISET